MSRQSGHVESGLSAVNEALATLGSPSLDESEHVVRDDGYPLSYRLEKPGAAPLKFLFYGYVEVWVGPYSEVLVIDALDRKKIVLSVRRLLSSSVRIETKKRKGRVTAWDAEGTWINLRISSFGKFDLPIDETVFSPAFPAG